MKKLFLLVSGVYAWVVVSDMALLMRQTESHDMSVFDV